MSLSWNFTIQDTSPIIAYAPFADGGFAHGWQPWYSESGFLKSPGENGAGDSYHISAFAGASFNLEFTGTGVNLYGTTNSSYDIFIDNVPQTLPAISKDLIFSTTSLENAPHNLTLTVSPSKATEQFAFDRAVVFSPVQKILTSAFYDNTDPRLTYNGTWKSTSASGIPNATVTHPFEQTRSSGSSVSMTFSGAIGVAINGPVLWGDWLYTVDLDGKTSKYNASTFYEIPDALRFFSAGLDPNSSHTITLANPSDQMTLSLNSVTLFEMPGAVDIGASASGSASGTSSASTSTSPVPDTSAGGGTASTKSASSAADTASAGNAAEASATGKSGAVKEGATFLGVATIVACSLLLLGLV
ncbi:hypothetical protein K438DRAFT_1817520 [Mycena galopus ATCC 62051]|nr:hypothetical protein K438DRAFT_1817520 [Mycena galopus ATCC 62051]